MKTITDFLVCNDKDLYLHWDNERKDYIIQQGKKGACVFKTEIAEEIVAQLNARYRCDSWYKEPIWVDPARVIKVVDGETFGAVGDYRNYTSDT